VLRPDAVQGKKQFHQEVHIFLLVACVPPMRAPNKKEKEKIYSFLWICWSVGLMNEN